MTALLFLVIHVPDACAREGRGSESPAVTRHVIEVPQSWESSGITSLHSHDGFAWYRLYVKVPSHWEGRRLFFSAGQIDDVDEVFFNGEKIGANGSMPPLFREPASFIRRPYLIEPDMVRAGDWNLVAIRVYDNGGEGGIINGPVQISSGDDALDLSGPWTLLVGDVPAGSQWPSTPGSPSARRALEEFLALTGRKDYQDDPPVVPADKEGRRKAIMEAAGLFKDNPNVHSNVEGKGDPLSPHAAMDQYHLADGLAINLALSEPEVRQPLYMDFDERGRMWVTQYIQYPEPAGIELITWDRHLRAVYDRDPPPPPFETPETRRFRGRDRITIHEDTDGDGHYDTHKVFLDGLNIATSTALDHDGVWVLNPPYLLFVPDHDRDDIPDGDPVVHLSGFGLEDTHSVANSLKWGPDGWLYGVTGSTVTARIRVHKDPDFKPLKFFGQTVWRYHPDEFRFELFAEGGWNNFGLEFDDQGRAFSGTNGGMQAVHFFQGGYYQKNFGKHGPHNNPYAFGYLGGMDLNGDTRRMVHQWIIYGGAALPGYEEMMVGVNPLANLVMALKREPRGSSFTTHEVHKTIETDHKWFRPVHITSGPDGAIYIADFYDARITHLDPRDNWDRERGRIYRITSEYFEPHSFPDFKDDDPDQLIVQLFHPNRWNRETARRLICRGNMTALAERLIPYLEQSRTGIEALETLWVLARLDSMTPRLWKIALDHPQSAVRFWGLRLITDTPGLLSDEMMAEFLSIARHEADPEVLAQLVCSIRRIPASQANHVLQPLFNRPEILKDPAMSNLIWWAVEQSYTDDPDAFLNFVIDAGVLRESGVFSRVIAGRLARRMVSEATISNLNRCGIYLQSITDSAILDEAVQGVDAGLKGQAINDVPESFSDALGSLAGASGLNYNLLLLGLRIAPENYTGPALEFIRDSGRALAERASLMGILAENPSTKSVPVMIETVADPDAGSELRISALKGLRSAPRESHGPQLTGILKSTGLDDPLRDPLLSALCGYGPWARDLVSAIEAGAISSDTISSEFLAILRSNSGPEVLDALNRIWPADKVETSQPLADRETRIHNILEDGVGDPVNGKALFTSLCGNCHRLFDTGKLVGPDLTGYERDDRAYLVTAIVNPALAVREGFELLTITTSSSAGDQNITSIGSVFTGFLVREDGNTVELRDLSGITHSIPKGRIVSRQNLATSIMPEGLLNNLTEPEIRDLFAWLQTTRP
jgi:putative membrane-bound dehydrogenase-like protein